MAALHSIMTTHFVVIRKLNPEAFSVFLQVTDTEQDMSQDRFPEEFHL